MLGALILFSIVVNTGIHCAVKEDDPILGLHDQDMKSFWILSRSGELASGTINMYHNIYSP